MENNENQQGAPEPSPAGPSGPKGIMETLDLWLVKKAPALPKGVKEFFVKITPWLSIVAIALVAPMALSLFGLSFHWGIALGSYYGGSATLIAALIVVQVVLQIIALPGLFARKMQGWTWTFYAVIVSMVAILAGMNILGAIIWLVIDLYILFQIRSYYH